MWWTTNWAHYDWSIMSVWVTDRLLLYCLRRNVTFASCALVWLSHEYWKYLKPTMKWWLIFICCVLGNNLGSRIILIFYYVVFLRHLFIKMAHSQVAVIWALVFLCYLLISLKGKSVLLKSCCFYCWPTILFGMNSV